MPGATTVMPVPTMADTATGTARGLLTLMLMPMPGATTVTPVPTMAATATGTARGPLRIRSLRRAKSSPDPTQTLTSMVPSPTPDTPALTPHTLEPTLMELTPMVLTTTARGPLMPTPGATTAVATDTDTVSVTAVATDTTDKRSAALIALFVVSLMSSKHPHHTKYLSHSC